MTIKFGSPLSNAFERLLSLQRDIDRAFESPVGFELGFTGRGVFPPINVFQDKDGYLVRVEVPGVEADKIAVSTHGQTLTIAGERDPNHVEGASYHRREREAGKFSRALTLPSTLDLEHVEASYKNGILSIRVPLRATAKPRQITVKAA